ncbi:MAG: 23S rRNA (uracil(1939)-C(5))-methyltransferase RlmD [Lachnospiraceae bacterium]
MKKEDTLELKIEDMGVSGEGIGKVDGFPLFVKDAVIGDYVLVKIMKLKKNYGYARLLDILIPSENRAEPLCKVHRQCGGCQIQALKYEEQLRFKERKVENNIKRIGGFSQPLMQPIIGMEEPYYYRNKAQFPVGTDRDGKIITGFYAGRTHDIIPNRHCVLGAACNEEILNVIIAFMEAEQITAYNETTATGLVRHVLIRKSFSTGQIMVCIVINGRTLPMQEKLISALKQIEGMTSLSLSFNEDMTNAIMGEQAVTIWGEDVIIDCIDEIKYQISPLSFFQVNSVQTEKMYRVAMEYAGLTGRETVWDLYCGIGTISLFLAQKAKKVYGIEIIPQAIADAKKNAALNNITNVEFYAGKAEEILPDKFAQDPQQYAAEVVVLDPPRKGCDEALLNTILQMQPAKIVYVSCDSATLARDLKILCGEHTYELQAVQPVDMFPQTVHVETVCLLTRME